MTPTTTSFFGLILWMLALLGMLAVLRTSLTFAGKRAANAFSPTGDDVSPFSGRLCRAHANCYEFLPFVLAVLLYAMLAGQTMVTDGLALVFLGARIAQSLTHLVSTSVFAVTVRFVFFLIQVVILLYWIIKLMGV
ncbi:MAG: MAPEG family protein [Pseudomonadota bacterium]